MQKRTWNNCVVKCKVISGLCGDYAIALTIVHWRVDFMRHVSEASGLLSTLNGLNESWLFECRRFSNTRSPRGDFSEVTHSR